MPFFAFKGLSGPGRRVDITAALFVNKRQEEVSSGYLVFIREF